MSRWKKPFHCHLFSYFFSSFILLQSSPVVCRLVLIEQCIQLKLSSSYRNSGDNGNVLSLVLSSSRFSPWAGGLLTRLLTMRPLQLLHGSENGIYYFEVTIRPQLYRSFTFRNIVYFSHLWRSVDPLYSEASRRYHITLLSLLHPQHWHWQFGDSATSGQGVSD